MIKCTITDIQLQKFKHDNKYQKMNTDTNTEKKNYGDC